MDFVSFFKPSASSSVQDSFAAALAKTKEKEGLYLRVKWWGQGVVATSYYLRSSLDRIGMEFGKINHPRTSLSDEYDRYREKLKSVEDASKKSSLFSISALFSRLFSKKDPLEKPVTKVHSDETPSCSSLSSSGSLSDWDDPLGENLFKDDWPVDDYSKEEEKKTAASQAKKTVALPEEVKEPSIQSCLLDFKSAHKMPPDVTFGECYQWLEERKKACSDQMKEMDIKLQRHREELKKKEEHMEELQLWLEELQAKIPTEKSEKAKFIANVGKQISDLEQDLKKLKQKKIDLNKENLRKKMAETKKELEKSHDIFSFFINETLAVVDDAVQFVDQNLLHEPLGDGLPEKKIDVFETRLKNIELEIIDKEEEIKKYKELIQKQIDEIFTVEKAFQLIENEKQAVEILLKKTNREIIKINETKEMISDGKKFRLEIEKMERAQLLFKQRENKTEYLVDNFKKFISKKEKVKEAQKIRSEIATLRKAKSCLEYLAKELERVVPRNESETLENYLNRLDAIIQPRGFDAAQTREN